jgi:RND superfamily putative drug exporter
VVHYRVAIVAAWLVVVVLGLLSAPGLSSRLTTSLAVPGTDSARADAILSAHFSENVEGSFTLVVPFRQSTATQLRSLEVRVDRAAKSIPTGRIIEQKAVGGVLYANVATSLDLVHATPQTGVVREALAREGLTGALVTGPAALNYDLTPVLTHDLQRGALLAVVLALFLLLAVLGLCWAIAVPFLVAGATVSGAIAVVFLLAHHFLMVLYVPNVIELIGLGLAIDYSLLMVHRFRSEIADTDSTVDDAIVRTAQSAGRTIVISASTVAIGLATLLLVPVPFVRSLGVAGLVVPVVALLASLTLQPALLSLLGQRGVRPVGVLGLITRRDEGGGVWARLARRVLTRPVAVLSASIVVLALLASSALWLELTPGSVTAIPGSLESARALNLVSSRLGPGLVTPNELVIDLGAARRTATGTATGAKLALAEAILHNHEVFAVAIDTKVPFVDATGRYEKILVVGRHQFGAPQSQQLVHDLRNVDIPASKFPVGTTISVAGAAAQGVDFLTTVYGAFPWIVLLALALAYVVLVRAFRSLLLPLIAVILDLLTVGVVYGLLVTVFRFGAGADVLGTYHVSQIEGWVPVFLFAVLFGLSMDYEVFIVTRMREARDRGLSTSAAITEGLATTGGVVSAAAVILVGALGGLVVGHVAGLQELGVGLSLGVLIDATIVRGLMLPSIMAILGRWNWWLPEVAARLVHAHASPLEKRSARRVVGAEVLTSR